jgi:hypothetical protein
MEVVADPWLTLQYLSKINSQLAPIFIYFMKRMGCDFYLFSPGDFFAQQSIGGVPFVKLGHSILAWYDFVG